MTSQNGGESTTASLFSRFNNFVADTAEVLFEDSDDDEYDDSDSDQSKKTQIIIQSTNNRNNFNNKQVNNNEQTTDEPFSTNVQQTAANSCNNKITTGSTVYHASTRTSITKEPIRPQTDSTFIPDRSGNSSSNVTSGQDNDINQNQNNHHHHHPTSSRRVSAVSVHSPDTTNLQSEKITAALNKPVRVPDPSITQSTISLLTSDLARSQQEIQNLRSVLHTFSSNADTARLDGKRRLEEQSKKHAHALQLLTTEMVAAKQAEKEATRRERESVLAWTQKNEILSSELDQVKHRLRLVEARVSDVERAEMIDRRLVRKALMQYIEGIGSDGCTKGGGVNHSAEDPVDLLAVILGLNGDQRKTLLLAGKNFERRRDVTYVEGNDTENGLPGMISFISSLAGFN
jgi:hypothetical protein